MKFHSFALALVGGVANLSVTIQQCSAKPVHFATPLKSLTIRDKENAATSRENFLFKFRAGIEQEQAARRQIAQEEKLSRQEEAFSMVSNDDDDDDEDDFFNSINDEQLNNNNNKWAEMSQEKEESYKNKKRKRIRQAFEQGFASGARELEAKNSLAAVGSSPKEDNEYQFVGLVNPSSSSSSSNNVKWFARKKPQGSSWSVRVINVDKAALLRDLFVSGKIDVYGEYANKGVSTGGAASADESNFPAVKAKYTIKERSWKNLWNFSPKNIFTDRSGMYWRQRRLPSGVYTDGEKVYETSYHYAEGRHGMKLIGNDLEAFLGKYSDLLPSGENQDTFTKKLRDGKSSPDLVLEY